MKTDLLSMYLIISIQQRQEHTQWRFHRTDSGFLKRIVGGVFFFLTARWVGLVHFAYDSSVIVGRDVRRKRYKSFIHQQWNWGFGSNALDHKLIPA